jgi:hypothetical protein
MRKGKGRKLLVASLGVAAVSYVACGGGGTVANLMAPPQDGSADQTGDAPQDRTADGTADRPGGGDGPTDQVFRMDIVANLVPPPR